MKTSLVKKWTQLDGWTKLGVAGSIASLLGILLWFIPSPQEQEPKTPSSDSTLISTQSGDGKQLEIGNITGANTVIANVDNYNAADTTASKSGKIARLREQVDAIRPIIETFPHSVRSIGKSVTVDSASRVGKELSSLTEESSKELTVVLESLYDAKEAGVITADNRATQTVWWAIGSPFNTNYPQRPRRVFTFSSFFAVFRKDLHLFQD
jgi:hypothetical protein